jgi:hypothetical protein
LCPNRRISVLLTGALSWQGSCSATEILVGTGEGTGTSRVSAGDPGCPSSPPRRLAQPRRRAQHLGAVADRDARAALIRPPAQRRHGPCLPGPVPVIPGPGGRPLLHALPLRRAQRATGEPGAACGGVALVEPVAPGAWDQGAVAVCRPAAAGGGVDGARQRRGDGRGTGGVGRLWRPRLSASTH